MTRRWRQVLDTAFQAHSLTAATWRPLFYLQNLGEGVCQKDLAASIGIEGPPLVRLPDTLLAKELIRRVEESGPSSKTARLDFRGTTARCSDSGNHHVPGG